MINQLAGYLPVSVELSDDDYLVQWEYFGDRKLEAPFFEDDVDKVRQNRVKPRLLSGIEKLIAPAPEIKTLPPNGFIFHMSKCGSTLVANLLKQRESTIVTSEPAMLIQLLMAKTPENEPYFNEVFRQTVHKQARVRRNIESHYIIKFYSAAVFALKDIQAVFPQTPHIFLFRDPVEVLVSNLEDVSQQWYYHAPSLGISQQQLIEDYSILELCALAVRNKAQCYLNHSNEQGMVINYKRLKEDETIQKIWEHFGINPNAEDWQAMANARKINSKNPGNQFQSDTKSKYEKASPRLKQVAHDIIGPVYEQLNAAMTF